MSSIQQNINNILAKMTLYRKFVLIKTKLNSKRSKQNKGKNNYVS
jgi:hypothetical protein